MWPFRRRETADVPAAAPVHRVGPGDWRHLTPITTVQTAAISTIDGRFEDHLATRGMPQFLRPLGHHLVPDGPSGRVAAAVVPGTRREFAPVPAQRQTASLTPATAPPEHADHASITGGTAASVDEDAEPVEAPTVGAGTIPPSAPSIPVVARAADRPSLVRAPEPPSLPSTVVPTVSRTADGDGPLPATSAAVPLSDAAADVGLDVGEVGEVGEGTVASRHEPVVATAEAPGAPAPVEVGLVGGPPAVVPVDAWPDRPAEPTATSSGVPRTGGDISAALRPTGAGTDSAAPVPTSSAAAAATAPRVATAATAATAAAAAPVQRSASAPPASPPASTSPPAVPTAPETAAPDQARDIAAPAVADELTTVPPLDRPMRTVIGPPIVQVPGAGHPAAPRGRPTVGPELLTPAPSAPGPAAGTGPSTGTEAPVQRALGDHAPTVPTVPTVPTALTGGRGAPSAPERPTIGSQTGVASEARPADVVSPVSPAGHAAGPVRSDVVTPPTVAAPDPGPAAPTVGPSQEGPVETRPTLTSEWLPAVARQALDVSGAGGPAMTAASGPTVSPTVPRGGPWPALPDAERSDDGVVSPSWSDPGGFAPSTFETTIATLGGQPGPAAPTARTPSSATPRTAIGPPISRSALQRTPLTTSPTGNTAPTSSPGGSFAAPPADRDGGGDSPVAEPITEWPIVQFELAGATPPPVGGGSQPDTAVMRAEATSGPAAAGAPAPAGRSDAEVDELLRAMYPQLRRQLCRDLLLDRERAGYGTDIRF